MRLRTPRSACRCEELDPVHKLVPVVARVYRPVGFYTCVDSFRRLCLLLALLFLTSRRSALRSPAVGPLLSALFLINGRLHVRALLGRSSWNSLSRPPRHSVAFSLNFTPLRGRSRPSLRSSCARPRVATVSCLSWSTLRADGTLSVVALFLLGSKCTSCARLESLPPRRS